MGNRSCRSGLCERAWQLRRRAFQLHQRFGFPWQYIQFRPGYEFVPRRSAAASGWIRRKRLSLEQRRDKQYRLCQQFLNLQRYGKHGPRKYMYGQ